MIEYTWKGELIKLEHTNHKYFCTTSDVSESDQHQWYHGLFAALFFSNRVYCRQLWT